MEKILTVTKDFKIIPENFKNAGELKVLEMCNDTVTAKVILDKRQNIEDYSAGVNVEIFGANDLGLIYFETKVVSREGDVITFNIVPDFSIIQRREYSRVILQKGKVNFTDLAENTVEQVIDISAGGLKIISNDKLELEKSYQIEIVLSNNMKINCNFKPVRIVKNKDDKFVISGKFADLENLDRIVLVQYAFKLKMEEQNKDSNYER